MAKTSVRGVADVKARIGDIRTRLDKMKTHVGAAKAHADVIKPRVGDIKTHVGTAKTHVDAIKTRVVDQLKKHVAHLKANPPTEHDISADPKGFLAKYGIHVSDDIESQIKTTLASKGAGVSGRGPLHIDV